MKTERDFMPNQDRYYFDFKVCNSRNNYAQIDTSQDAFYYGMWANPFDLIIITFAEGDVIKQTCDTKEEFIQVIKDTKQWCIDSGHEFRGIDSLLNNAVEKQFVELGLQEFMH
jgi:hypothetical protein